MELTTPAVMLSTVSLLILAYTNRFLAVASLARTLHERHRHSPQHSLKLQIKNLSTRLELMRDTQAVGVLSLLLFVLSMFLIFSHLPEIAKAVFGLGLFLLMASLVISTVEIFLSTKALKLELAGLDETLEKRE
jgi:hypothetical protein